MRAAERRASTTARPIRMADPKAELGLDIGKEHTAKCAEPSVYLLQGR